MKKIKKFSNGATKAVGLRMRTSEINGKWKHTPVESLSISCGNTSGQNKTAYKW